MFMTIYEGPLLVPMRSHHKGLEEGYSEAVAQPHSSKDRDSCVVGL